MSLTSDNLSISSYSIVKFLLYIFLGYIIEHMNVELYIIFSVNWLSWLNFIDFISFFN